MWPKVSFVIPTLNSEKVIRTCIDSIITQDYDPNLVEIVISDGGSKDRTLEILRSYKCYINIVSNPLKTGEAGKAVGIRASIGDYIALIDSDNVLPNRDWLKQMIEPLINTSDAVGSEPWKFEWRATDGFIDRYCALMGMNDPICYFIGNYDRVNVISGKWTNVPHTQQEYENYIVASFSKDGIPTIGANGTVFRSSFLKNALNSDYLFDIDILEQTIYDQGSVSFIKVKNSIIHNYCGSDIGKFIRKQRRRINDLMYYREINARKYNWGFQTTGISIFIFESLLVFPLIAQSIMGYAKKPDTAWFFHPIACWIGLVINTYGVIFAQIKPQIQNRTNWSQ